MASAIFVLLSTLTPHLFAAEKAEDVFSQQYNEHYLPRHCGINVKNFIRNLNKAGVNTSGYYAVVLTNPSFSWLLVNAEKVRDGDTTIELNWHFHVFVVGPKREVYDFSYGSTPQVVPYGKYVEDMYLDETECQLEPNQRNYSNPCVGKENKLRHYKTEWFRAADYYNVKAQPAFSMSLGKSLK